MTISSTERKSASYVADGVNDQFEVTFKWYQNSDVVVKLDGVVQASGFSLVIDNNTSPGQSSDAYVVAHVVFDTAPANGVVVLLEQDIQPTQETDYMPFGKFPAESHEKGLDKVTLLAKQAQEDIDGATLNSDTDVSGNSWVIDEDDMASDLDTKVPTQQSTKAFVEGKGYITDVLTHVATENDDDSFKVNTDAAGFGDIKALQVNYDTGSSGANVEEAGVIVNLNETDSLGGEFFGYEIVTTDEGSMDVYGLKAGVQVGPLAQFVGTFGNAASILVNATDQTSALSTGGAGNVNLFAADNDTVTVGLADKFNEMEVIVDTGASNNGISPTFEYSTGVGTWATFSPSDATDGFQQTGVMLWDDAVVPGWAVGTGGNYLIRITRTRNNVGTTPIVDLIKVAVVSEYKWDKNGDVSINSLGIGVSAPLEKLHIKGGVARIERESASASVRMFSYGGNSTLIEGNKANGTELAPTAVTQDQFLIAMVGKGYGSTAFSAGSKGLVAIKASENWTDAANGTYITLETAENGTTTRVERVRVADSGDVGIGTSLPVERLHVSGPAGTVRVDSTDTLRPQFTSFLNTTGPASGTQLGRINFRGRDAAGSEINYGQVRCIVTDSAAGAADGVVSIHASQNSAIVESARFSDTGAAIGTTDIDTRLNVNGAITQHFVAEPADPADGKSVEWYSNGTGAGDIGDKMAKINVGGTVKTITLIDYSAS